MGSGLINFFWRVKESFVCYSQLTNTKNFVSRLGLDFLDKDVRISNWIIEYQILIFRPNKFAILIMLSLFLIFSIYNRILDIEQSNMFELGIFFVSITTILFIHFNEISFLIV